MCGPFWRRGADTRSFPLPFGRRRRLLLLLLRLLRPLLPLLLSSSCGVFSRFLSLIVSLALLPFPVSLHPAARTTRSSFLLCESCIPFFSLSPSSLHPSGLLRLARASLYTGARHESTLGGLAVSSFDSSRWTCYPLWPSHWLGLLPARLIPSSFLSLASVRLYAQVLLHRLVSGRARSGQPASGSR